MNDYCFSKHAEEQMKLRNISKENVLNVLANPDIIIGYENDASVNIYQAIINEDGIDFLFRVFVNIYKSPKLVITVYKTTKISKYQ